MCKKTFTWILNSQSWYHFDKQTCILLYIRTFILVFFIHTTALKKMPISLRLLRSFFSVALFTKSYNSQSVWNKLPKCNMTISLGFILYYNAILQSSCELLNVFGQLLHIFQRDEFKHFWCVKTSMRSWFFL